MTTFILVLAGLLAAWMPPAVAGGGATVFGGRVACVDRDGVRFCEGSVATRVPSWDGVPIDVNVTMPPAGQTPPFPLVIQEHGWGLQKSDRPDVDRGLAGYVVLSQSARGFHGSCGTPASRDADPVGCAEGWTHLGDARFEVRDAQYLAGLLVDEGWVDPQRIGMTGASYGGGRTIIAAALKDRTMLEDGTLVPWTSPLGTPMRLAAGAATIPWSDLPASLVPNGATLDYRAENPYGTRAGVRKDTWNDLLYVAGLGLPGATGFYAPTGVDPRADLRGWNVRTLAGEPYDADSAVGAMIDELTTYHSGYYIEDSTPPAPLFIYNAWTDDLFPADEALRFWRKTAARHPSAEMAVLLADDGGHPRAALVVAEPRAAERIDAFFARHLLGVGDPLPVFEVFTQGCRGAPELGPFTASDWDALRPGEVRLVDDVPQRFDEVGGDPAVAAALNPIAGPPCRTVTATTDPGAATWILPPATGDGYVLIGSPTVVADLVVTGAEYAQVAGRLWDVAPDGMQTLVTHGFYRPRSDNLGPQVFQLPPNGWHFAAGHAPKLELLGQSVPMGHASHGAFAVTVETMDLRLPVMDAPDGGQVLAPAAHVFPPDAPEPPRCPPAPVVGCEAPAGSSRLLVVRGKKEAKDRLVWAWRGDGPTDPGTLAGGAGATLCLWDGAGALALAAPAPESGTCGTKPCWSASAKRARYRDRKGDRTGVGSVGVASKRRGTQVRVRAKGERLAPPPLPIATLPITVQLLAGDGSCRGATFETARKNDERRVKAKDS